MYAVEVSAFLFYVLNELSLNVTMWEHCWFFDSFFSVVKFSTLTLLSLLILCKLSFQIVGLTSSLPALALKYPNKIFVWNLGNSSLTLCNSS
jgi:hypothetical protein